MTNLPFPRASFVGFDELFKQLERAIEHQPLQYPPHNIVKYNDTQFDIELAVAGFDMDDLDIEWEKNVLTITGDKKPRVGTDDRDFVHRGISQKKFIRKFNLADHIEVVGADLHNGILSVKLELIVPEELKPRKISISKPELLLEENS